MVHHGYQSKIKHDQFNEFFLTLTRTTYECFLCIFKNSFSTRMLCIFKKPLLLNILEREPCMSVVKPYRDVTFLQITLAGEYDVTKWTHWFTMLLIRHSHHCLLHMVNFTLYTVTFSSMYDVTVAFLKNSFSRVFIWLRLLKTETI